MTQKPNLVIFVGNIGSGKTTQTKDGYPDYQVISRDALRYMIGAGLYRFSSETEPFIAQGTRALVEVAMRKRLNIIIDETNMSRAMREPYLTLGKAFGYNIGCYLFNTCSRKEAINRRCSNGHGTNDKKVWAMVYDKFQKMYQMPTIEEGFDWIYEYTNFSKLNNIKVIAKVD